MKHPEAEDFVIRPSAENSSSLSEYIKRTEPYTRAKGWSIDFSKGIGYLPEKDEDIDLESVAMNKTEPE